MDRLPTKLPFSKKRLRARVIISYILDYVILVALFIGFWILDAVEPYHQPFSLTNISLQYPYVPREHVTIQEALLASLAFPVVVIAIYTLIIDGIFSHHKSSNGSSAAGRRKLFGVYRWKDRLWEFNCGILGLFLSQALAFVITNALKNAAGKPRPDIIDRCQPRPGSQDQPVWGLSNSTICTQTSLLKDGFRSWPSGHSSSSFAGLFYLSLYLCGKMHVMDNRGEVWKTIIIMIPVLGATLIAVSRIVDNRHHPFDVITGSMLGVFVAWASYRQYFPSVFEPWKKGRAHAIRTWGTEPIGPPVRLLSQPYDDAAPLRNPDEEMLNVNRGRRLSGGSGIGQSVSPGPVLPQGHTRHRRHRDREAAYSSSSSEEMTDGFEMSRPSTRPGNVGQISPSSYQPYNTEAAYSPAAIHDDPSEEPTASHPGNDRGRPLTSIGPSPEA